MSLYVSTAFREAATMAMTLFVFLARLYHYDDDKLAEVEQELSGRQVTLELLHLLFYKKYMTGFCTKTKVKAKKATINIHVMVHLLESRRRTGPLHLTSAEPFESLYAVLRRCFRAGTRNTGKQIFENYYMRDK